MQNFNWRINVDLHFIASIASASISRGNDNLFHER